MSVSARPSINLTEVIAQGGQVIFRDADWGGYQRFYNFFQKQGYGKVAFCDGILEIMGNESLSHGMVSYILGNLIGTCGIQFGKEVYGGGTALIGSKEKNAGKNPDESFWFDREPAEGEPPDLVVEVVVATEAISKQEFYAKFKVPELWVWEKGRITVFLLKADGKGYKTSKSSRFFPELDMELMERCSQLTSLNEADRQFREGLGQA